MKSVSAAFQRTRDSESAVGVRQVFYKRRYWDQTSQAYVWESSWTLLDNSRIVSISPIVWNLDTDQLNAFRVSNVTLTVANERNEFVFMNRTGFFSGDSVSRRGYEPYWTKFQILAGFALEDGTEETVAVFTGYAEEFTFDAQSRTVQIQINGPEAPLVNRKAERIATVVTEEVAGTANGTQTDWITLNPGVGEITEVSINGIKAIEGGDYSSSNLQDPTQGATVAFTTPPDAGTVIRLSYYYWPQDLPTQDIAVQLATAGGVPTNQQHIASVSFGRDSVQSSVKYDRKSEWETGTLTHADTTTVSGLLMIGTSTDAYDAGTVWGIQKEAGWTLSTDGWTKTQTGQNLFFGTAVPNSGWNYSGSTTDGLFSQDLMPNSYSEIKRDVVNKVGRFDFSFKLTVAEDSVTPNQKLDVAIGEDVSNRVELSFMNGYLGAAFGNPVTGISVTIYQQSAIVFSQLQSWSPSLGTFYRVIVSVTPFGVTVRVGSQVISANVRLGAMGSTMRFSRRSIQNRNTGYCYVQDIAVPDEILTASWLSPTIDWGSAPTAYQPFSLAADLNTANIYLTSILAQLAASSNGSSWDAYTDLSDNGIPSSALKRYARVLISLSHHSEVWGMPNVDAATLRAVNTTVNVLLPAFEGKSIWDALGVLAAFANYEYGFTPDEHLFFRPKRASGSSVLRLDESNVLSVTVQSGLANVYSSARVTYGNFVREVGDTNGWSGGPLKRFVERRLELQADSSVLFAQHADIASVMASLYYRTYSTVRRRITARAKFFVELDLSDLVTISFVDNRPSREWLAGDTDVDSGQIDLETWGASQQLLYKVPCKVIGARYDIENWTCELTLEEAV